MWKFGHPRQDVSSTNLSSPTPKGIYQKLHEYPNQLPNFLESIHLEY